MYWEITPRDFLTCAVPFWPIYSCAGCGCRKDATNSKFFVKFVFKKKTENWGLLGVYTAAQVQLTSHKPKPYTLNQSRTLFFLFTQLRRCG